VAIARLRNELAYLQDQFSVAKLETAQETAQETARLMVAAQ